MTARRIVSLGAALVDTEIRVTDQDIEQVGLGKGLMTLSDARTQQKNLDHLREHISEASRASGGSAANSMIAVARLGGSAHLTCQVANDDNGHFFLRDLQQAGVAYNSRGQNREGVTGTCLVLITPDAERTMNTCLGVSEQLSIHNLDTSSLEQAGWLYLEGYLATSESGQQAAIAYALQARQQQVPVAISLSDPGIVEHFRQPLTGMAKPGLNLLFANLQEALSWTQTTNLEDACRRLDQQVAEYAITLGAQGARIAFHGQHWHIPGEPITAVDSNGAGDAFAGAYLHARALGMQPAAAGLLACYTAALVVAEMGPRLNQAQALLARKKQLQIQALPASSLEEYRL